MKYHLILFLLAILPVIILLIYTYRRDGFEKEPFWLLALAFFGGIVSVLIDLIIRRFLPEPIYISDSPYFQALYEAGIIAAACEEFSKFLVLFLLIWRNKNFNEYFDGIIYAVFISLGFAALENVQYHFLFGSGVTFSRAMLAIPGHFLFGVAMGYFFSLAKFSKKRSLGYLLLAFLVPAALHTVYDFPIMLAQGAVSSATSIMLTILFYAVDVFIWIFGIKRIKKLTSLDEK